ncbi:hypothetical protein FRC07_001288 [Ceratobasidium sp. 392]|nr:hypothetical protein FRC07_001288 [Ceratobasidium sp. 392]
MDAGAEALARRAQRFGNASAPAPVADEIEEVDEETRLAELLQLRAAERKEAEQEGVLSSGKTRLEEAKDLVGTCPGMISEYQYYWRKLRYNNIHSLEKDEHGQPQWYLTIKDYARSAAGNEQELPSDVRPPDVLLVSELVELFGCDGPEDVRAIVDAVAEASRPAVRKLRPKGSDEIRAYRLTGSMKFPSHFPRARRNVLLIDSKRPTHVQLADVVNQPWDQTANEHELAIQDIPDLILPDRVDIEETAVAPVVSRSVSGLESSRIGTPFGSGAGASVGNGSGTNGVFAGFGAVGGAKANPFGAPAPATVTNGGGAKANPFGTAPSGANTFGEASSSASSFGATAFGTSPFGGSSTTPNPFGGATTAKPNPFGSTSTTSNPFSTSSSTPASNPFGAKPALGLSNGTAKNGFGAGASAFGAGAGAFGAGSGAFGAKSASTAAGTAAAPAFSGFAAPAAPVSAASAATSGSTAAPVQPFKPPSPSASKLSPFATSFVPKFTIPSAPARPAALTAPEAPVLEPSPPAIVPESENTSAAEAAKAAREAKLKEKLEAARREEARLRAEEERRAEERRKQEELKRQEEEDRQRQAEAERQRLEAERLQLEAKRRQEQVEREQAAHLQQERLHSATAQLLLGDILEILVVPEVQYAIEHEKGNRVLVRRAFEWWKARAAKRVKRRRVLENMGLGRVGVAGAVGEVGELFDEEDEEGDGEVVPHQRRRTVSLREHRTDAELAVAMAKAAAERERLWAPGVFFDIAKRAVANAAREQDKTLDDVPGWDIWLCTSGANKSSLYNLADTYTSSLAFAEAVDLNVLRSAIRQYRHSGKAFPARFFCERLAQLVDIALTPLVSGNRPRSDVYAAENAFEAALADAVISLEARAKKRTQDDSPVRDNKKARLVSADIPTKPRENGETGAKAETSGADKLRALLDKTRNRWATETEGA